MRTCLILTALLLALSCVNGKSIKWTGYADNNQWNTKTNWYPDDVPSANDDVTISCGLVIITTPVTVNSLGMGDSFSCNATLEVLSSFTVIGTLTVEGNGILTMTSGASSLTPGQGNIAGSLVFTAGQLSGLFTVSSAGNVNMGGGGMKVFSGAGFNASGPITASGLIVLNQSSVVGITSTITASGDFSIQAQDNTAVVFDTSAGTLTYTGGGTFSVQAPVLFGTFNWQAGNLTLFTDVNFAADISVPSGSELKTLGTANVMLNGGLSGMGEVKAEGTMLTISASNYSGAIVAQAGNLLFSGAGSVNSLYVTGSTVWSTAAVMVSNLNLQNGQIGPSGPITAASATILSPGFIINGSLVFTGTASVMGSVLAFGKNGKLTVASGATLTASATVSFTGPAGTAGVVNHGVIDVTGAVTFQNIDLKGTGSVTVSDELRVNTITFSQSRVALSGAGVFKGETTDITNLGAVSGSPMVDATIGSYSFACPKQCDNIRTIGIPTSNFHFKVGSS